MLEELITAANNGDKEISFTDFALASMMAARGFVTLGEKCRGWKRGPFMVNGTITRAGWRALLMHSYRCWGCGDHTTGTKSKVREYDCCPSCIERCTETNKSNNEPDDDPGPFRARPVRAWRQIKSVEFAEAETVNA
jgi:hypothetical protein